MLVSKRSVRLVVSCAMVAGLALSAAPLAHADDNSPAPTASQTMALMTAIGAIAATAKPAPAKKM